MAKKNNPQDEQMEEMLHKVLGRYQEILFKVANSKKDEDVYGYTQRFFSTVQTGATALKAVAKSVVDTYIPNIDTPVSTLLQSFGARYGGEEIKLTTYVRMVNSLTLSMEQYRSKIEEQIREREGQGKVTTVMDLQDIINQDLRDDNVTVVRYANGTSVPVDKYASMLARTTRAETENLSMIGQALREGIDLVECDVVSPTCDSCAVYQGRVYSISGKDSRYPALYKTAFKSGYSIIHPNCRHSWSPYHVELYTDEERRETLEKSNRTWKSDGDGKAFQQTERLREEYARGQQKMRQWNAEIVEYERMKAYYAEQGQEPPYKSLGAFRRAKRANAENYEAKKGVWSNKIVEESQKGLTNKKKKHTISIETLEEEKIKIECAVDWSAINTKEYQDGVISLADGKKVVGTSICKVAKTILEHRQGTEQEDLYLLDARTGNIVYKDDTSTAKMRVEKTPKLMDLLSKDDEKRYISVHNHPKDGYPSATDFNALYDNPKIKYGIIVGHKGTIYKYTAPRELIGEKQIDFLILHYRDLGYSERTAKEKAYQILMKKYEFKMEVLRNGS